MLLQASGISDAGLASWTAKLPQIVVWILVAALAAQAAYTLAGLAGGRDSAAQPSVTAPPPPRPAPKADIGGIVAARLFGAPATPAADASTARDTSMALVLTGIVAADGDGRGIAILGPNATAAKVYRIGDSVPGGATLHSVYSDRVLLDRGGTIEALRLPQRLMLATAVPPARAIPAAGPPPIERVQQVLRDNPGMLGDIMRPQAVLVQGQQRGMRVFPGPNREAFLKLGLRPGDMVTAINGTPLDDPARAQEIFNTLSSAAEARVSVTRNGKAEELTLNLAQVAAEAERLKAESAQTPSTPTDGTPPPGTRPGRF